MPKVALKSGERRTPLAILEKMPGFLETAFGRLSSAEAVARGPGGTFSPVEQCWHLADLEREGYRTRIAQLLSEDDPFLPDFDGDRIARERRYRTRSLAEGLRAFRAARLDTLSMLRSIRSEQWERSGRLEGGGPVALHDMPAMIAEHDASHRGEIQAWMRGGRG